MNKRKTELLKSKAFIITFVASIATSLLALVAPFAIAIFEKDAEREGFYGQVALRSYFERGTGRPKGTNGIDDPGDPYVITRPRHMYNLSRLQGLGVFNEPTFFQLGLVGLAGDDSGKPLCYLNDSTSETVPFLDMTSSTYTYEPINAIGSEAVPFYGEFDGQGLEIKNLEVFADPEDAGLFGYTAHGSIVHDLFLSNITINALGYTSSYADLYGNSQVAAVGTAFTYECGEDEDTFTKSDTEKVKELYFDASAYFAWDGEGDAPAIPEDYPVIGFTSTNSNYKYKMLISGDFLTENGENEVRLDLPTIYQFFKEQKADLEADDYPLNASSSVSLIASTTDNYGLDHSKVIASLDFDISLPEADSGVLTLNVILGGEHTNNIGFVIGHCDGSLDHCYVNNGEFKMNNGNAVTGNTYYTLPNGSNTGLIGMIGGTVHNVNANETDGATDIGKSIGVLDFSTVYDDVITPTSFSGSTPFEDGVTYVPSTSEKYKRFLRVNSSGKYITQQANTVSFNRQKVISNTDLGIFTIATDYYGTGMYDDATNGLNVSTVLKENTAVNSKYYVYYATGEYDSTKGITFDKYRDSFNTNNPSTFHLGYHLPGVDEMTSESFEERDRYQNYFFRFQIDHNYRAGKGFYFSDIDKTTVGGSFLSKYFENKLVDQNGYKILASANSKRSGIMLRDSLGREIRKLESSFATPDYSYLSNASEASRPKMIAVSNATYDDPASNMVNFEIKTPLANVTVVAGLADRSKPAALGVYRLDNAETGTVDGNKYYKKPFESPDYAFFMPVDDHLAYFDYVVDGLGKGRIGTYDKNGTWSEADVHTDATVPNTYASDDAVGTSYSQVTEYGYDKEHPTTRLYAHTFKLPRGRYCLGSATGTHRDGGLEGTAKIYYVCAQGQTDGQLDFSSNIFASADEVKNYDFTRVERYTYNPETHVTTTNITMDDAPRYDPATNYIECKRIYVLLANRDRSLFTDATSNIRFYFDPLDNKFKITTDTLGAMEHVAVSNYAINHALTDIYNTTVVLFSGDGVTTTPIVYPAPETP